jgi:hypothetical protein
MRRAIINLYELEPTGLRGFIFEPKDGLTLRAVEHAMMSLHQGDYRVVGWVDPDETRIERAFEVIMEFPDDETRMEWVLRHT